MTRNIFATLSNEDLSRLRMSAVDEELLETNPDYYSLTEAKNILHNRYSLISSFINAYGIPTHLDFELDKFNGHIYVNEN